VTPFTSHFNHLHHNDQQKLVTSSHLTETDPTIVLSNMNDVDELVTNLMTQEEVEVLNSSNNDVMQSVASALSSPHVRVKTLRIRGGLRVVGAQALCDSLVVNTSLKLLSFQVFERASERGCVFEEGCMTALSRGLSASKTLKKLYFHTCGLGVDDARVLAAVFQSHVTLEELYLNGNPLVGDEGAILLAGVLLLHGNGILKKLTLDNCGIGYSGAAEFGRVLEENCTLEMLCLNGNRLIGNKGAIAIARGLSHNKSLTRLELSFGCGIGEEGVAAFGQMLKTNKKLQQLGLCRGKGEIGREGLVALADGLSWNTTLLWMDQHYYPEMRTLTFLTDRINGYLQANRFLETCRTFDRCNRDGCVVCSNNNDGVSHWPYVYSKVSAHPAALFLLLRENCVQPGQVEYFGQRVNDLPVEPAACSTFLAKMCFWRL
jgi:hypothetical protein